MNESPGAEGLPEAASLPSNAVGEGRLGDYARRQLNAARVDPRLGRDGTAILADYFDYVDEAERVRVFAIGGIESMIRDRFDGDDDVAQAAWERSEMAKADRASGHSFLNGVVLVGLFGNLDSLVERLGPSVRDYSATVLADRILRRLRNSEHAAAWLSLDEEARESIRNAAISTVSDQAPDFPRLYGSAPERWERVLTSIGLSPRPGASIPSDMASTLQDFSALRDVLVHRAGRVDKSALKKSPGLATRHHYSPGDFVQIGRSEYRRYSAALRSVGAEVEARIYARSGVDTGFDLADWQSNHYVGS